MVAGAKAGIQCERCSAALHQLPNSWSSLSLHLHSVFGIPYRVMRPVLQRPLSLGLKTVRLPAQVHMLNKYAFNVTVMTDPRATYL